jgi:hypothetical protein
MNTKLPCIAAAAALAGCAAGFVPTSEVDMLATAGTVIGIPSTELRISNVRRDMGAVEGHESYDVTTRAGVVYACSITRETLATTIKPQCKRK